MCTKLKHIIGKATFNYFSMLLLACRLKKASSGCAKVTLLLLRTLDFWLNQIFRNLAKKLLFQIILTFQRSFEDFSKKNSKFFENFQKLTFSKILKFFQKFLNFSNFFENFQIFWIFSNFFILPHFIFLLFFRVF